MRSLYLVLLLGLMVIPRAAFAESEAAAEAVEKGNAFGNVLKDIKDDAVEAIKGEFLGSPQNTVETAAVEQTAEAVSVADTVEPINLPPGLAKKGELPPGLAKKGKIPAGWSKGNKEGFKSKLARKESKLAEKQQRLKRVEELQKELEKEKDALDILDEDLDELEEEVEAQDESDNENEDETSDVAKTLISGFLNKNK